MAQYRKSLPQVAGDEIFLTDGGLETLLIFHEGVDLPYFAAFDLMKDDVGRDILRDYYRLRRNRGRERARLRARGADLAGQSRLGRQARLWRPRHRRDEPRGDRS